MSVSSRRWSTSKTKVIRLVSGIAYLIGPWMLACLFCISLGHSAESYLDPANVRYANTEVTDIPDMQRHVLPLLGRLGCNGRSCHGSFQGQGGFRLSMFGYDFATDHQALTAGDQPRVDLVRVKESLILRKPSSDDDHEGGKRFEVDDWSYRLLRRWIESGAKTADTDAKFVRLEVLPSEILFQHIGERKSLKVIGHWSDGSAEDVTPLSRFQTNDGAVTAIDSEGRVTCVGPGDTHVVAFYDAGVAPIPVLLPMSKQSGEQFPTVTTPTRIDELLTVKLRKLGILPSSICTDEEFLRRVTLDITGQLPLSDDVTNFISDKASDKRCRKIDQLLSSPAYATWWATKLCDITGNNERYLDPMLRAEASQNWYEWIRRRIEKNMPYDELVAGIVLATSRRPGQSFEDFAVEWSSYFRDEDRVDFAERDNLPYYWARAAFRTPSTKALHFSYAFLGVRLQCAECHKHPFDQWTQTDFNQFTALFDRVSAGESLDSKPARQKMRDVPGLEAMNNNMQRFNMEDSVRAGKAVPWQEVFVNSVGSNGIGDMAGKPKVQPKILGGIEVDAACPDPRVPLMEWLRSPDNPYFARAIVNRVWATYFHRGIIEPVDDQNLANPPANEALLDYLSREFIANHYDLKWLHREIVSSDAYQRSWKTNETNKLDERNFSHAVPRRLPAESLCDAISQATTSLETARVEQANPRRRAIAVQGSTAQRGVGNYALQMFGKPARIGTCDCERSNEPNLLQAIYLENDEEVIAAIERRGGWLHMTALQLGIPFRPREAYDAGMSRKIVQMAMQLPEYRVEAEKLKAEGKQAEYEAKVERIKINRGYLGMFTDQELEKFVTRENTAMKATSDPPPTVDELIREAYLRVLSRDPTDEQFAKARLYVEQSTNTVVGLRDLLWALINSYEFCVNR
ncbi:MAG: DUF1549 and DUF1553 domain-containing protein [Pirellulaceae bacterium]|nr:DUF1549 and DUF1553 domain-containing protein [Pirellulaceae bacterium]